MVLGTFLSFLGDSSTFLSLADFSFQIILKVKCFVSWPTLLALALLSEELVEVPVDMALRQAGQRAVSL